MRQMSVLVTLLLFSLAVASPALAAKPDHSRAGAADPVDFVAGEVCEFAVSLVATEDRGTTSVWEFDDGTVRLLFRGFADGYAVNTEDDIRYRHAGGYRVDVVIHPDGSVDVEASGVLFAWYFPGEPVTGLSAGLFAIRGHGTESYTPDGSLASATFSGHAVDLCDALAPPS